MKRASNRGAGLVVAAVLAVSTRASAQASPCPPGVPFCFGPNGVVVQAPAVGGSATTQAQQQQQQQQQAEANARARAEANARAQAALDARAQADARIQVDLEWSRYAEWQVSIHAQEESAARASLMANLVQGEEQRPDGLLGVTPPFSAAYVEPEVTFPRLELGLGSMCVGETTRFAQTPSLSWRIGYCPPVRYRFGESWALTVDPTITYETHDEVAFTSVGLRPGLLYSFAIGHTSVSGSHAFVLAGLDVELPTDGGAQSPSSLVGAHVGIGAHRFFHGVFGIGVEARGFVREGFGNGADSSARDIAAWRLGFEGRATVIMLGF